MYLKSKNLKCVDLSEGFIEIGHDAFGGGISLENITLQKSMQEVGEYAFDGCPCEEAIC